MLITKEKNVIFKNKYIEIQDNLVENTETHEVFKHIKIIENGSKYPGSVSLCEFENKFLLLKIYRYGIDKVCWELPRGYRKRNESLENCAIREVEEETGLGFSLIDKVIELGKISVNSSYMASEVGIFLLKVKKISSIELQTSENIYDFHWFTLDEVLKKINEGEIIDSFTINAFMLYCVKFCFNFSNS